MSFIIVHVHVSVSNVDRGVWRDRGLVYRKMEVRELPPLCWVYVVMVCMVMVCVVYR